MVYLIELQRFYVNMRLTQVFVNCELWVVMETLISLHNCVGAFIVILGKKPRNKRSVNPKTVLYADLRLVRQVDSIIN